MSCLALHPLPPALTARHPPCPQDQVMETSLVSGPFLQWMLGLVEDNQAHASQLSKVMLKKTPGMHAGLLSLGQRGAEV